MSLHVDAEVEALIGPDSVDKAQRNIQIGIRCLDCDLDEPGQSNAMINLVVKTHPPSQPAYAAALEIVYRHNAGGPSEVILSAISGETFTAAIDPDFWAVRVGFI